MRKKKDTFCTLGGRYIKLLSDPTCLILRKYTVLTSEYNYITAIRLFFVRTNTEFIVLCKKLSVVVMFFECTCQFYSLWP